MKYKNKTIIKREDNRYMTRLRVNGKQVSIYGKTQIECLQSLKQALKQPKIKSNKFGLKLKNPFQKFIDNNKNKQ